MNQPSPQSALLRSPQMLLALIVGVAILVAALMVVLSQLGGAGGSSASSGDVGKLYSGIPQNGFSAPSAASSAARRSPRWWIAASGGVSSR